MKYFHLYIALVALTFLSCEKEVSVSAPEPKINEGIIIISSDPAGSMIFLKGKNTGKITPDTLTYLDPANYEITLKKKNFKDTTLSVLLSKDQKQNLYVDYFSNPSMYGNLKLITQPDNARIFLNDSLLSSTTPLLLTGLFPGEYDVKFELVGYRSKQLTTTVKSSDLTAVTTQLRDTTVWVDYKTNNSGITSDNLTCIAVDSHNKIWIGSNNDGLISFNGGDFVSYSKSNSAISSNTITCLFVDEADRVWIGTDAGVNVYDGGSWRLFNSSNSILHNNNISSIKSDVNGLIFINTPSELLSYDGTQWTDYSSQLDPFAYVIDFEVDDDGTKWIATTVLGIYEISSSGTRHYTDTTDNIPTNNISSVIKSADGNKWFTHVYVASNRGGISVYNGSSFETFFMGTSLFSPRKIFIDSYNTKWISSNEGIFLISTTGSINIINISNSLISSVNVRGITADANGVFWIATFGGGLNKYKSSQ